MKIRACGVTGCTTNGNLDPDDVDGFEITSNSNVTITNSKADNDAQEGIDVEWGTGITVTGCSANNNGGTGIDLDDPDDDFLIEDSQVCGNAEGISVYEGDSTVDGTTDIHNNDIEYNTVGLYVYATSGSSVDASGNWWGDASGPSGVGFSGSGDLIVTDGLSVIVLDWLSEPIDPETCFTPRPPQVPTMTQWGMMAAVALPGLIGVLRIGRRRND